VGYGGGYGNVDVQFWDGLGLGGGIGRGSLAEWGRCAL